ncbi:hypothetical protein [Streptomyces sp. NPDC002133]|uniref:hypothetical protein n=1 Tax=Streptomyces sp. NPDC002133 TaxID=3154409 RepID=UPI003322A8FE
MVSALGSTWGLARHYWVTVKLVITLLATIALPAPTDRVGHHRRRGGNDPARR